MCVFEKRTNSTQRRKGAVFGFSYIVRKFRIGFETYVIMYLN